MTDRRHELMQVSGLYEISICDQHGAPGVCIGGHSLGQPPARSRQSFLSPLALCPCPPRGILSVQKEVRAVAVVAVVA